jgi:hypothetical protein
MLQTRRRQLRLQMDLPGFAKIHLPARRDRMQTDRPGLEATLFLKRPTPIYLDQRRQFRVRRHSHHAQAILAGRSRARRHPGIIVCKATLPRIWFRQENNHGEDLGRPVRRREVGC